MFKFLASLFKLDNLFKKRKSKMVASVPDGVYEVREGVFVDIKNHNDGMTVMIHSQYELTSKDEAEIIAKVIKGELIDRF